VLILLSSLPDRSFYNYSDLCLRSENLLWRGCQFKFNSKSTGDNIKVKKLKKFGKIEKSYQ